MMQRLVNVAAQGLLSENDIEHLKNFEHSKSLNEIQFIGTHFLKKLAKEGRLNL
jgi:hypothetical protein